MFARIKNWWSVVPAFVFLYLGITWAGSSVFSLVFRALTKLSSEAQEYQWVGFWGSVVGFIIVTIGIGLLYAFVARVMDRSSTPVAVKILAAVLLIAGIVFPIVKFIVSILTHGPRGVVLAVAGYNDFIAPVYNWLGHAFAMVVAVAADILAFTPHMLFNSALDGFSLGAIGLSCFMLGWTYCRDCRRQPGTPALSRHFFSRYVPVLLVVGIYAGCRLWNWSELTVSALCVGAALATAYRLSFSSAPMRFLILGILPVFALALAFSPELRSVVTFAVEIPSNAVGEVPVSTMKSVVYWLFVLLFVLIAGFAAFVVYRRWAAITAKLVSIRDAWRTRTWKWDEMRWVLFGIFFILFPLLMVVHPSFWAFLGASFDSSNGLAAIAGSAGGITVLLMMYLSVIMIAILVVVFLDKLKWSLLASVFWLIVLKGEPILQKLGAI